MRLYIPRVNLSSESFIHGVAVGEVRFGMWLQSPDPDHWILCTGTLGSSVSGADYAGDAYQALYVHLYSGSGQRPDGERIR